MGRERFDVVATGRGPRPDWCPDDVRWVAVDLLDIASVAELPAEMPYVLHLASETVPANFGGYGSLLDSVTMTLNLCRHLRSGRLLFASSCLVYGASGEPLNEASALDPRGHYGLAKVLCEEIVSLAGSLNPGIDPVIARPFNHIGVGMRPDLAIPSIVRRVRAADDGAMIEMAGLDSVRDFLDVADIVDAYFSILECSSSPGRIFNVASGSPTNISQVVTEVARILGKRIAGVSFAEQGSSADDTSIVVGNASKLRAETGWAPRIGLEESLQRLVQALPEE